MAHNVPIATAITNAHNQAVAQSQSAEGEQRLKQEFIDAQQSRWSQKEPIGNFT